jgi:hypothetical protein
VLSNLEVRQLVSSAEPDDHARLSAHFGALSQYYASETARHRSMARGLSMNPNRAPVDVTSHCERLADWNARAAATVRELAAHHATLAAGFSSMVPEGATPFENGAGAREPTAWELDFFSALANTPTEHFALEEYFLEVARRHSSRAAEHVAMGNAYRGGRMAQTAAHCDRMIREAREAAAQARGAAALHRSLAPLGD